MNDTFDLLTLALLPGLGPRAAHDFLVRGPLGDLLTHAGEHGDLLPARARAVLRSGEARQKAEDERQRARARGIRIVGQDETDYPRLLREIYDPPPVLYVRGRLEAEEGERSLAIVGARAASPPAEILAERMAGTLAAAGVTIVSGLARGIDTRAHRGALSAKGRTVAVLGSGLDRPYPPENASLLEAVAETGAVVSEFPLGFGPRPRNFPQRNRIISGWARAVVVVEAGAKSGALVTARCALEQGRDVFAVPGHPSQAGFAGTNQLIRDGAALVRDATDVAQEIGLVMPVTAEAVAGEDDVLRALRWDAPLSLDELQERSRQPVGDLLSRLSELEMGEKVRRLPGTLFIRC